MHRKFNHIILLALITSVSMMFALTTPVWANQQSTATIEVRVSQGDDDAEENTGNGQVNLTSSDLELVRTSVDQIIGVRFQNVMIPKGSTITNAYILFTTDETDTEPTSLTIWGEDVDDAKVYEDKNWDIYDRNKTAISVVWNDVPAWGTVGETGVKQQSPDLTTIVQEIVDRGGWDSGKAMAFIIEGSGKRVAESYNGSSSKAPLLHVEFTSSIVDIRVIEESDDAEQRTDITGDNVGLYSSDLDFRQDRLSGIRFQNVTVPPGAEITAAYIEFTVRNTNTGSSSLVIDVEMHDDPPTFYDVSDNISNRILSGNYVEWDPIPVWDSSGATHRTPDISSLVQQIVGRSGWFSGNAMVFVIEGMQWNRSAATYDYDPDLAPRLHIEFGEGEIGADEPIITIDREYLGATTLEKSNPAGADIALSNTGTGKLVYTVSDTASWLTVSPSSGDLLEGSEQIIKVAYSTAALAPGTYETTITITDSNALNNPVEIQVSVTIEPIPEDLSCGNIPVYTENLVSPAILILLDVSGSMKAKMEVAPEVEPQTPDLTAVVQEIVDRPGWASGNAMAFILQGIGRRTAVAYDQDSAKAPLLHVEYNDGSAQVLDVRVNQDSDDAEEQIGQTSVNLTSGDLEMSWDNKDAGKSQVIGLRFQDVTIPQGAIITNAYIEFQIDETDAVDTTLIIWGEDMDNPPTFANTDDNISGRIKTIASVNWMSIEKWTGVTKERRIDIGRSVISDLVKDRAISWGFGTWCSKKPWKDVGDGSYTLIHEGTKANTDEHQAALQAAVAGIKPNGGTPFSYSIEGATNYFKGAKKDKDETGELYVDVDCQPKFLIEITDGQGNTGSSKENTNSRTEALADAGVTGVGVGFGLDVDKAEQLYEMSKIANARGKASATDDLYALHEEVAGTAEPFFANNKQELVKALTSITESVKGAIFHGSAPAPTTSADLGDTVIVAKFDASRWTGDVEAVAKDANGLWVDVVWAASEEMPAARSVWTVAADETSVINYTDATLASDNFACLNEKPIGDIINSTPVVVGRPPFFYPFNDYSNFLRNTTRDTMIYIGANDGSVHAIDLVSGQERWAFIPKSMQNKLNQAGLDPLYDRCAPEYCHQYYVDGSPVVGDVFDLFDVSGEEWRTVMVVGEREGGEAYFALDVTTGKAFGDADPTKYLWEFTDDQLGQTWSVPSIERVAVDGSATDTAWGVFFGSGYFGNPTLQASKEAYLYAIHANDSSHFWQDEDGLPTNRVKMAFSTTGTIAYDNWVSSFAAPSQVGQTVTGVTSGATGTIVAVNIITMYSHGSIDLEDITGTFIDNEVLVSAGGGEASVNGTLTGGLFMGNDALASPLLVDIEADYIADRIYAGNLYGNMYRALNIGEDMTPQVSMLFSFENNSPHTNPIRARASFAYTENDDDIWVYFGTGRYEGLGDKTSASQQYFMGLKDSTTPVATYYPDDLVTLLAKFKTVAIDGNDVTVRYVEGTNDLAQSWKMQLDLGQQAWGGPPAAGSERVITQPLVVGGIVFFTTFIPDENICAGAGETWVFALDYNSGLAPTSPVFDINGDGNFDDGDMVTVDGQPVIPVGIKVGRGQGSNPVIHKDTLFITTTGDGDDGGGSGNPEEDFFAKKINLPDKRVRMESWKLN